MTEKRVLISLHDVKMHFPLKKSMGQERKYVQAVDGVTLDIYEDETFGLVGESGCGKSTLGRVILQLYKASQGTVSYNGIELSAMSGEEMRKLRKELQIVFQDPYSSLNPRLTVGQLISEALVAHGMYKRGERALEEYVLEIMDKCGLQRYMLHRYPHQFSGGQRQRIGIARALALNPKFIVCDESVSTLDVSIQSQIINLLLELKIQNKLTYMFISHDLGTVRYISDRIGVMYLGNIIELADSEELFLQPMHPYTMALIASIPSVEEGANAEIEVLEGDVPSPIDPPTGCKFHPRCKFAQEICTTTVPKWRECAPRHFVACHFPHVDGGGERDGIY